MSLSQLNIISQFYLKGAAESEAIKSLVYKIKLRIYEYSLRFYLNQKLLIS